MKASFLGGAHSVRPHRKVVRMPRQLFGDPGDRGPPKEWDAQGGGLMGKCPTKAHAIIAGVRSLPLRDAVKPRPRILRESSETCARADFLGDTVLSSLLCLGGVSSLVMKRPVEGRRSPRPDGRVGCEPGHVIPTGCVGEWHVA